MNDIHTKEQLEAIIKRGIEENKSPVYLIGELIRDKVAKKTFAVLLDWSNDPPTKELYQLQHEGVNDDGGMTYRFIPVKTE